MKLRIEPTGAEIGAVHLVMEAQNDHDLEMLFALSFEQGALLHRAEKVVVAAKELGFAWDGSSGESWPQGDGGRRVCNALRLDMRCRLQMPLSAAQQLRADTASRVGHSLLDAFELLGRNTH